MSAKLRAEIVPLAEIGRHRDAWAELADRCLEPCIFVEPAFALPAARHLIAAPGPLFVLVWRGERLVGLCAVVMRGLRGHAAVLPHPQATSSFPLLDRDDAADVLTALLAALRSLPGRPAALLVEGVPEAGPTSALIRARPEAQILESRTRAVLLPGTGFTKPGKEMRRQARRLAERGAVRYAVARSATAVSDSLPSFLTLEMAGWKGRRGTALGQGRATRAFVEEAVAAMAAEGRCSVHTLSAAGTPVAASLVLHSHDRAWFWKIAYDETLGRYSPGVQLTLAMSAELMGDPGLVSVDSCAVAGHSMIDRLWPGRMMVFDHLIPTAVGAGWRFRLAMHRERAYRWLRQRLKDWHVRLRRGRRGDRHPGSNVAKS